MSEQTFKSPNFFEREIDLSAPAPTGPVGVPAGVIGTSNKGPAFVPVTVANFNEFIEKFGNLDSKHFGVYATNEFLKNRTALTYLRVLGAGANTTPLHIDDTRVKGIVKNAGFVLSASSYSAGGAPTGVTHFLVANHEIGTNEPYGMPLFTENDTMTDTSKINLVRAAIMVPAGARIMLTGSADALSGVDSMPADATVGPNGKFKLIVSSSTGAAFGTTDGFPGLRVLTASFDPSDKDYFAKILNRDPDKFVAEQHYLHCDFAVDPNIAFVNSGKRIAVVVGSKDITSTNDSTRSLREVFGSYDTRFTAPKTSYFISQPFGKTEYDLFRFEAIDDGEYANTLYKISISNIKASTNNSNKYGTFNVQIRNWGDVDTAPEVIEQFTNCSLDPNSENYIAKLIGDRKVFYNFDVIDPTEKRIVATGKYPNVSKYVRVVMNEAVEKGIIPAEALPFGFHGPEHLNVNVLNSNALALAPSSSRLSGSFTAAGAFLTSSFMPPVPHRFKVTRGETDTTAGWPGAPGKNEQANPAYYWGVKFERSSVSSNPADVTLLNCNIVNEKNPYLESLTKFQGIEKLDALVTGSNKDVLNNNKFTLAKVAFGNGAISHLTSSVGKHMREAAYIRNAVVDNTDYSYNDPLLGGSRITFATLLASGTASEFNRFSSYAKFTNFMYGGFDGTNFLNRDARRINDKSVSFDDGTGGGASDLNSIGGFLTNPSGKNIENNGVASYLTAVDIMTDPMAASNNLLVMPGIREPYINDNAMIKVRDYGLSMLVADIPSYNDDNVRLYDDSTDKINVKNTANKLDDRGIDNNYAATYFPSIYIDDAVNRRKVKVPASVAALGALGFNDRVSYPWFAPAGFNRAALDFVTNVDVRLNVSDRDRLYESRINPIATFPRLGFVIYGQKTLQVNKSALDRVNVRRLMLEIKRIIIGIAQRIVFEQNTPAVRNKFVADASFQLGLVQVQAGIEAFQVVMNESNNTQEDMDLNRLNGRIVVVPTRVVEYIAIDFIITNSGVQFV